ncbi:MAG: hypothetical protein JNJ57_20670, partial [Saprospiraceae bacterium]|nr:hypothetical protein [Saprospiraceae bacterium]
MKKGFSLVCLLLLLPLASFALKTSVKNANDPTQNDRAHFGEVIAFRIDFDSEAIAPGPYKLLVNDQTSAMQPFSIDTINSKVLVLYFLLEASKMPKNVALKEGKNTVKLDVSGVAPNITKVEKANFTLLLSEQALKHRTSVWRIVTPLELTLDEPFTAQLPEKKDVRLYCQGILIDSARCIGIQQTSDTAMLSFEVNTAEFAKLFYVNNTSRPLEFGVGTAEKELFSLRKNVLVDFMRADGKMFFWLLFILIGAGMIWLITKTDIIKDTAPDGVTKTYSLARTQFALWTFLVLNALIYIFFTTKALSKLPPETFILLGMSAAVTLGGRLVENDKESKPTRKNCKSKGGKFLQFLTDLISDNGVPN